MDGLLGELDPEQFVRIHRSAIVRIDRVRELTPLPSGDYSVVLRDGTTLTLSRTYRDRVGQVLGRPL
jgi:two-component system LytT family response regulator